MFKNSFFRHTILHHINYQLFIIIPFSITCNASAMKHMADILSLNA